MKNRTSDPITGPHHYWMHFWFGLVVGAILGWRLGEAFFAADWKIAVASGTVGLILALAGGRWGDQVWEFLFADINWFR
jgi:hypothetical protein